MQRRAPARTAHGRDVWLYGRHAVLAAIANPSRTLARLLATPEHAPVLAAAVEAGAGPARPRIEVVDRPYLEALLPADAVHQGVAALAHRLAEIDLDELLAEGIDATATCLVLDQATDPRNVGAILRSAEAFGAFAVVVQDRHAPEESGALAKAASGALERVPLIRVVNVARTLRTLAEEGFRRVGLEAEGGTPLCHARLDARLGGRLALVVGAEGRGLRRLVREACDEIVRIPIAASVDSLNVATAAAIALYERNRTAVEPT